MKTKEIDPELLDPGMLVDVDGEYLEVEELSANSLGVWAMFKNDTISRFYNFANSTVIIGMTNEQ